jgi:hypothetical protein
VFERSWLIKASFRRNYTRLRNAAIDAFGADIPGRTLQVASAHGGDFPLALAASTSSRIQAGGMIVFLLARSLSRIRALLFGKRIADSEPSAHLLIKPGPEPSPSDGCVPRVKRSQRQRRILEI